MIRFLFLLAFAGAAVLSAQAPPTPSCLAPPTVSSTLPTDTIITDQNNFNCFGWQEFIALTWKAGVAGQPDPNAKPSQYGIPSDSSPLVWETYAPDTQVFLPNAAVPPPFGATPKAPASCSTTPSARMLLKKTKTGLHILSMTSKFDDVSQSVLNAIGQAGTDGAWLTAQNQNIVYYEIRMNQDEYNYIVKNQFYNAVIQGKAMQSGGPGISLPVAGSSYGPSGAVEVKAAWLEIEDQSLWPQYRMVQALVLDYTKTPPVCRTANMGLVGLHIIHKTPNAQQLAWATFEHINNAPSSAVTSGAYTFYNPTCNPQTDHYKCVTNSQPKPCSGSGTCDPYTAPVQVLRITPLPSYVQSLNQYVQYQIAQANKQSVFQYYEMVNVLWPNKNTTIPPLAMTPLYNGNPQPPNTQGGLANATLETYFQGGTQGNPQLSCTDCHVYGQIAAQPTGTNVQCSVTTIQGQNPPGPCATSYSFLFGEATCPKGTNCGTQQTLQTVKMKAALLRSEPRNKPK